MPDATKMQSPQQREAPSKNRAPEMHRSQFKLSDGRLTFRPTDGISYVSQDPVYPAVQKLGNSQPFSAGLDSPPIKKEFPDENAQAIKPGTNSSHRWPSNKNPESNRNQTSKWNRRSSNMLTESVSSLTLQKKTMIYQLQNVQLRARHY